MLLLLTVTRLAWHLPPGLPPLLQGISSLSGSLPRRSSLNGSQQAKLASTAAAILRIHLTKGKPSWSAEMGKKSKRTVAEGCVNWSTVWRTTGLAVTTSGGVMGVRGLEELLGDDDTCFWSCGEECSEYSWLPGRRGKWEGSERGSIAFGLPYMD